MVRRLMVLMVLMMLKVLMVIVMSNLCEKEVIMMMSSHRDFLWRSSLILASLRWFYHPSSLVKVRKCFFLFQVELTNFMFSYHRGERRTRALYLKNLLNP